MKLLTRLRELRNQYAESETYDSPDLTTEIDSDAMGVGAVTTPDIARLNLEKDMLLEALYTP